jgi:hypothetical protein
MPLDSYQGNADWIQAMWNLPDYKSNSFYDHIQSAGMTLQGFKKTRAYQLAVSNGLIVDDEWTGMFINWGEQGLLQDLELPLQVEYRILHLREAILEHLADMQALAGRALSKEETGKVLLVFADEKRSQFIDHSWINIGMADVAGIDDLVRIDQIDAWTDAFHFMSEYAWRQVAKHRLPQIWQKAGARATWYPNRNLIVVPSQSPLNRPQLVHACTHWLEMVDQVLPAVEHTRDKLVLPGTLHMIRNGLWGLRGPWLDQHDGALRQYDAEWLQKQYEIRREFSRAEIAHLFSGRPTEILAMMGQRFARADPIDISSVWARTPDQLLLYLSVMQGNFFELQDTDQ